MASTLLQRTDSDGEIGMSARIRAFDWAATPLGPIEAWPQSLRFAFDLCEHSSFPTAIYWGPDLRLIYNDAWAPIPGERHPAALGQPAREVWADIWPIIEPQFRQVIESRRGFAGYQQMLPMVRDGVEQETYWNYSFTPLFGDNGEVAGVLNQGNEITSTVLAERRMAFQIALADRLRGLGDPESVKAAATAMLGEYLGAARVGYAEIDTEQGVVSVRSDWTRDTGVRSLAGGNTAIQAFGPAAGDYLRSGETLIVPDFRALGNAGEAADIWERIGSRAAIIVPLVREGELRAVLYVHDEQPRQWKRSDAAMARDVAERTWEAVGRAQIEQSLRESEDHYRHAIELHPQVSWTADASGRTTLMSWHWEEWTGTSGVSDDWHEGIHAEDKARQLAAWRHAVETGEGYDVEYRLRRRDAGYRWVRSRANPRRDAAGNIMLWYGVIEDIHDRKVAEEHQRLLINELNHRVKNTLATVQAIAFQTLKGDISLVEARRRFEARLMALSRAHNLLTEQNWEGAALEKVVRDATEYLAQDRFEIAGDSLWLAPRAALALALALHELGTNAAKYGALSNETGRVMIRWSVDAGGLRIEWKEQGGPPVAEPAGRGFGSRLIERGLAADLGGPAKLLFEPDGLRCVIEASLQEIQAREDHLG